MTFCKCIVGTLLCWSFLKGIREYLLEFRVLKHVPALKSNLLVQNINGLKSKRLSFLPDFEIISIDNSWEIFGDNVVQQASGAPVFLFFFVWVDNFFWMCYNVTLRRMLLREIVEEIHFTGGRIWATLRGDLLAENLRWTWVQNSCDIQKRCDIEKLSEDH